MVVQLDPLAALMTSRAPRPPRRRMRLLAPAITAVALLAACSSDGGGSSSSSDADATVPSPAATTDPSGSTSADPAADTPLLAQISTAMQALDEQLGSPQQYFEVNATSKLVNLFVSLNNGAVAQPWVYLDGTLSSAEGQPASGGTFGAASVTFDPATILSTVRAQLPDISIQSFYIHGDGAGHVLYGLLATASKGGGLDIVLGDDGSVKSVDPVN